MFWPEPHVVMGTETRNIDGVVVTRELTAGDLRQRYEETRANHSKPHFLRLKIFFSTEESLPELAKDSYALTAKAVFCNDLNAGRFGYLGYGRVHWQSMQLDGSVAAIDAIKSVPSPRIYYFYANVATVRPGMVLGKPLQLYDLQKESKDVCFDVSVPGYSLGRFGGYRSNRVTIPSDVVVTALRDLPPYFR